MKSAIAATAVIIVGGLSYLVWPDDKAAVDKAGSGPAMVNVLLPETLSKNAQIGKQAFDANCAVCHGTNAQGQDGVAPPLVHIIYEPGHHGDESFQRAVALGVRGHHWPFGDMPAVDGLAQADVAMIIAYVRELQQANGIN